MFVFVTFNGPGDHRRVLGFFDYLNSIGAFGLVHLLISPYYLAYHHQHRGKELIRALAEAGPASVRRETPDKIALFTDTLDEINGVAITIKRLIKTARARGVDLSLVVVGDGPYRNKMEECLKGYPALFTGYLSGEELQRAYASSDLFVFPGASDTFGNVVLEAQTSGLPVIVSDQGGPMELMTDGETGIVFSAGNVHSLIGAISELGADHGKRMRFSTAAREHIVTRAPDSNSTFGAILGQKAPNRIAPLETILPQNQIHLQDSLENTAFPGTFQ